MRKINLYKICFLVSIIIAGFGFSSASVLAFVLPPTPVSPTVDPATDVSFYLKGVGSAATNISAQASSYMQEQAKILKAAKKKYMDKFTGFMGGMLKKKEKKTIPGSKTIKKSKIADIYDPESVKKALYKLFLAYPTTKKDKMACYNDKRGEFYEDTVIEVYTSVRQLEIQLKEIETEINGLTNTLVAGQGASGAESNSDDNGVWKNYYIAFETMDELLQVTEELVAMKAQYEAAKAVNNVIEPAIKNDKSSSLIDGKIDNNEIVVVLNDNNNKVVRYTQNDKMIFAQGIIMRTQADKNQLEMDAIANQRKSFESTNNIPAVKNVKNIKSEEDEEDNYEYDPSSNGMVEYVAAPPSNMKSPYDGNEAKMNELEKLTPVYNTAQEAIEVHAIMKALPTYKETFERYEQFSKLHKRSLEVLNNSEKCAIQYLGRYYSDPEKVWHGGTISEAQINEYDLRTGISAWAIKAFEVAKSEQAAPLSSDELGEFEIDRSIDSSDLRSADKQKEILANKNISATVNPSKDEELEKINRETGLLNWKIGAEAATLLVKDQYSVSPKWDGITKKFPIWHDQRTFYNQYIDGKYSNIKEHIKAIDINAAALQIAYKLNDVIKDISDEDRQANIQSLNKIDSLLKDENYGNEGNFEATFKALADNKDKELENANKYRDNQLKTYNSQKTILYAKLDRATELVKIYNQRINQLSQEALLSDAKAEAFTDMVDAMEADKEYENNIVTYETKSEQDYEQELVAATEKKVVDSTTDIKRVVEKSPANNTASQLVNNKLKAPVVMKVVQPEKAKTNLKEVKTQVLVPVKVKASEVKISDEVDSYSEFDDDEELMDDTNSSLKSKRQLFHMSPVSNIEKQSSYQSIGNLAFAQVTFSDKIQAVKNRLFGKPENKVIAEKNIVANEELRPLDNNVKEFDVEEQDEEIKFEMVEKTDFIYAPVKAASIQSNTIVEGANVAQNMSVDSNYTPSDKVTFTPITTEEERFEKQDAVVATYTRTLETTSSYIDDEESGLITKAKHRVSEGEKSSLLANQNKKSLRTKVIEQENVIKKLQEKIAKIDADIEIVQQAYITQAQVIEVNYNNAIIAEKQKLEENKALKKVTSLVEIYNSNIKNPLGKLSVLNVLGNTDAVVGDSRDYAIEAIDRARSDIMALGEDLYLARSGKLIAKRHIELMDELKNLPSKQLVNASSAVASVSVYPEIMNVISTLYQQALLNKACAGDNCKKIDEDYFVGIMPKSRDFMVPKAAPDIFMPPLREVIYFDEVDYTNVPKLTDGLVTKDGFLKHGNKIPEIWKLMLRPHAYVEKDIDLSSALNLGGEALTFMRGGRLPCRFDGKVIDVGYENDMYVVYKLDDKDFPVCQELKLENSGLFYTVVDIVEDVKGPAFMQDKFANIGTIKKPVLLSPVPKVVKASELGVLLMALNNNLQFNKIPNKIFDRLSAVEKELSANNSYEKNLRDEIYKKALLKQNQIGNFLNFVELEIGLRQTRDELAIGIEDAKKRLFTILEKVGFTPKENLNLANPDDYELVRSQLDRLKNKLVTSAYTDVAKVDDKDNLVVEERLNKLKRILGALRKDKDELTSISEVTADDAELDEQIKAEEVNLKVAGEYAKKANDEMNKQLESFSRPYCAAY